jgi:hypothetical protein
MNTRKRLAALLASLALGFAVAGTAVAEPLKDAHQGITVGWDAEGNPVIVEANGFEGGVNPEECDGLELAPGDIVFHFVWTAGNDEVTADPDAADNLLDVDFTGADDQTDVGADSVQGQLKNVDWNVWTNSEGGNITLETADYNNVPDGGQLVVSHICVGDQPEQPSEEPSFEQSQETETDEPSEEVPSEEPSFEQSQETETDEPSEEVPSEEPSFEQSQEAETDAPSEPDTATIGGHETGAPTDSAWLLMVALGLLLSSIVVMTPARARSKR